MGEIESVKAVSDLFSPVSGEIAERNPSLNEQPEAINDSPYDSGWMLKVYLSDVSELDNLLSQEQYEGMLATEGPK
jgi:glycine cleavage system H protein